MPNGVYMVINTHTVHAICLETERRDCVVGYRLGVDWITQNGPAASKRRAEALWYQSIMKG